MHGWIDRNEFPFESRYFKVPDGKLHYVDEGAGEHAVVMVHGNPTWCFAFRHLIKVLSSNFRCIALDHLGFGLSDKPRDGSYLPKSHAANLELLLDELDISSATLIVEDWGGPIGLSYAIKNSDKINSLVLMNTWLWSVKGDPHFERFSGFMGSALGRFLIKKMNFFARVVVKQAYGDKSKLTPHIHKHYLRPLKDSDDRIACSVFPKEIIGSSSWLDSLWEQRSMIEDLPTLILWGKKDIAFREKELEVWRKAMKDTKIHEFEDVGHFVHEELGSSLCTLVQEFIFATRKECL